jgi:O-acetyl-ADP-ribose deacetylase (regulator of RNase III)
MTDINYIKNDITKLSTGLIIHGVNCLGIMGSGVALAIKNKWPSVYKCYKQMPTGKQMLGQTHIISITNDLYIANCYTQLNFGNTNKKYADINAVEECLSTCFNFADINKLKLCSPKIASDRGGLDWEREVKPIFLRLNNEYNNVEVAIYYI